MYYHFINNHDHGFEISIQEFMVMAENFVKNGFNVSINLNEFAVDDNQNSNWGWSLLYDNKDGFYHLCCPREQQSTTAEWICEFFKSRDMLNI
jgi:hypothetical protein